MYKPQFAAGMPARFDMEVKGITTLKLVDNKTRLSGTDLTPFIGSKPFTSFKIMELEGTISPNNEKLSLVFNCYKHSVTYVGDIKK